MVTTTGVHTLKTCWAQLQPKVQEPLVALLQPEAPLPCEAHSGTNTPQILFQETRGARADIRQ